MLDELLGRLRPQCRMLAISANGDPGRFAAAGCPVIADASGPSLGPLSGVLAGLDWLRSHGGPAWLLTVPGDTPFIPPDLAACLRRTADAAECAAVRIRHADRLHPLVGLWSGRLRDPLRSALYERDLRRVTAFQNEVGVIDLAWPTQALDPFININTPDDLDQARRRVADATA